MQVFNTRFGSLFPQNPKSILMEVREGHYEQITWFSHNLYNMTYVLQLQHFRQMSGNIHYYNSFVRGFETSDENIIIVKQTLYYINFAIFCYIYQFSSIDQHNSKMSRNQSNHKIVARKDEIRFAVTKK